MTADAERGTTGGEISFPGRLYSVSPTGDLTGAPISSLNHVRLLRKHFRSACLVLPASGDILDRANAAGLPVLLLPVEYRGLRTRFFRRALGRDLCAVLGSRWRYFWALCREFRREPGVVHVHSSLLIAPLALLAARLCGLPAVLHVRDAAQSWGDRWRLRALASLTSAVVCVSDGIRQGYGAGIRRHAQVIYNFMDLPPPAPPKGRTVPLVVMPARMGRRKGFDIFLEACRRLRDGGNAFEAWMVGGWGSEADHHQALEFIKTQRLEGTVLDRGVVADMVPVYAQMDVLLLTSRRDPLPRVIMEAMGHGIPVVATRVDGIPEMVEDGVTGFLVEPEDADGFAAAVERLLKDKDLRQRMGLAGRVRAQTLFSPEAYAAAMLALYKKIGGGR